MTNHRLTPDDVRWAYRLLLDREVESDEAIDTKLRAWQTTGELRLDIMTSEEFGLKNPAYAAARGPAIVIKPLADGTRLFVDLSDHVIGGPIARDQYEQSEVRAAVSLLREGDVALDIGAHVGFFTVQMASAVGASGHVYSFEPLPRNADLLAAAIRENGFGERVTLERCAVSDRNGEATFMFAANSVNSGGGFLGRGEASAGLSSATVRTVRVDDLRLRRPVRLIKLDVEGAEPAVLAGAAAVVAEDQPYLLTEVHPEQLSRVSQLSTAGYFAQLARMNLWPHRILDGAVGEAVRAEQVTGVTTVICVPGDRR